MGRRTQSLLRSSALARVSTFIGCGLFVFASVGADWNCAGDGTVELGSPGVTQSAACRTMSLPGLPDTFTSVVIGGALVLSLLGCIVVTLRRSASHRAALTAGLLALCIGVASLATAITATGVTFVGAG